MTPGQMLRTAAYWWIAASVALATPAVLLFSPRILELARQSGLPETAAGWMGQMLRTAAYWWIAASVALATPAVLLFSPRILELARQSGLPETAAGWMVAVGAAGSAAGRPAFWSLPARAACRKPPPAGWWQWARRAPPPGG